MRRALATLILCTLSACATYGNSIGLSELKARRASLTSRIVQVHGWLTPCGFRSCLMVESRDYGLWLEQAGALERRMEARGDTSVQFPPAPDRHSGGVSFRSSRSFDKQVTKLRHSLAEVVVEARVTDQCWSSPAEGKIVICGDRANQLEPIKLVKVIQQIPLPSDPEDY